ncbi:MAG TPA: DnaA/Hda family protein, partial [Chloroflexota bacterium]|nr:DnaA/Hda family protein [Chloroflexota bacterium]
MGGVGVLGKPIQRSLEAVGGTAPISSGDDNAPDQGRENLNRIPAALMAACDECADAVRKSDLRAFGPKNMCPPCFAGVLATADATMRALLQQNPEPERRCSGCAAMIDPNVGSQWCSILELGDTRALLCQNFVPIGLRLVADSLPLEKSSTADEVWSLVCGELGASLGPTHLDWLAHANATSLEAGILTVGVPDEYTRSWLVARLMPAIWQALEATGFSRLSVEFVVGQSAPTTAAAPKLHRSIQPIPLQPALPPALTSEGPRLHHASGFNPSFSFEQFVVGTGNRLAHAGALSVADGASNYNPLFIYGGVGVGKTHLLQAIGGRCVARGRAALYVASETFTNELIAAIRTSSTGDFRQ